MKTPEYSIKDITEIVKGKLIKFSEDNPIKNLVLDSRKLTTPDQSLFFAIRGQRHDGHQYIQELYRKGVRNFIVSSHSENIDLLFGANIIEVDSSLHALQRLAAHHRSKFDFDVVGITGSNGKTIVKEWLYQLMQDNFHIVRSPKSFNSQVGVPLSIWNIRDHHNLGIFEAGISKPGEMERLEEVIKPRIGIFTNLGSAHQENFGSYEEKAMEKLRLFNHCEKLIYCADQDVVKEAIEKSGIAAKNGVELIEWSSQKPSPIRLVSEEAHGERTKMVIDWHGEVLEVEIPFADRGSVENAMHCLVLMKTLGIGNEVIVERMKNLVPVAMRLELLDGINNCSLINDVYNSDVNSLEIALDFLNQQRQHQKKTVILSDILQSGLSEERIKDQLQTLLKGKSVNRLIGVGEQIKKFGGDFNGIETEFYDDTEKFIENFSQDRFRNENILVKGARKFKFEKITELLQQKEHDTVLEVNLTSMVNNLNKFKALLRPTTRIMAMVKAFSYGSGSYEIANVLEFNRVDYLAVAYPDEGVELRKAGISLPILVMSPQTAVYEKIIRHRLEPEIYNMRTFRNFTSMLRGRGFTKPYPIHLKIDTGMHRLGFTPNSIPELISAIREEKSVHVASIFSHLAASDVPEHDSFTHEQIDRFQKMASSIMDALPYKPTLHILNSSGITRFTDAQFDMVRLGIGLYGISNDKEMEKKLEQVSRLKTVVSQVKVVPAGESVGYSRDGKVDKDTPIAILPIGYADGLSRKLSNGRGKVYIHGQPAPVIGNICMDMTMVNVSHIACREGDEVIVFDGEHPVHDLADDMETIPYEVLTSISTRVKRVYTYD